MVLGCATDTVAADRVNVPSEQMDPSSTPSGCGCSMRLRVQVACGIMAGPLIECPLRKLSSRTHWNVARDWCGHSVGRFWPRDFPSTGRSGFTVEALPVPAAGRSIERKRVVGHIIVARRRGTEVGRSKLVSVPGSVCPAGSPHLLAPPRPCRYAFAVRARTVCVVLKGGSVASDHLC